MKWAVNSCYLDVILQKLPLQSVLITYKLNHYLSLPFQFYIIPKTTVKVTKDTLTVSELSGGYLEEQTVQLKDADPKELQLFIDKMPASVKGKSANYNFSKLCLVLVLE